MRHLTGAIAVALLTVLAVVGPASAQDTQVGELVVEPASVPEPGEYEINVTASGLIPDTSVLLGVCVAPGDELVFGEATEEEIAAAVDTLGLDTCDIATAQQVDVGSDGSFTATATVTIGPNTFVTAADIAQTQGATMWIPIVAQQDDEPTMLAETGTDTLPILLTGMILIIAGGVALTASRRFRVA